jgi:alkanesulfonate monooxygenase SsuD/methylene tetrahydromethanopterin reductase-like flavin-dependent oxidoreductase (luciferase family)
MRHCVSITNFGAGLGAREVGELAALAESAGWGGFFLWDHVFPFAPGPLHLVDPWVALTVAATRTTTIRLGTMVTPLPRRRPLTVARQTAAIDQLSGGRLILGVGIGAMPYEWDNCGEERNLRVRGDMLDESLEIITALWTGEPVLHRGRHYTLAAEDDPGWAARCYPPPAQQPRIPVWVAGTWPGGRPFRRAAEWDGVVPMRAGASWTVTDTRDVVQAIARHRTTGAPYDVVVPGETEPGAAAAIAEHEAAGATWWAEAVHPWRYGWAPGEPWPAAQMADRIAAGPR